MKKRILATAAASGIAAMVIAALPAVDVSSPATVPVADVITPHMATTDVEEVKAEVLLTKADLDKAKQRVKDGVPKTVPKDAQGQAAAADKRSHKGVGPSGKGDAEAFKKIMNEAGSFAEKAKAKPFKFDKVEATKTAAGDLPMEKVNAWTHTYAIGDTPPAFFQAACFDNTGTQTFAAIFDRYTYCSRTQFTVDYWEVDATTGAKTDHLGTSSGRMEILGQNYTDTRSNRQFARIQKDSVSYDWGWYDNFAEAPGVYLSLNGECEVFLTGCSVGTGPATMTWGSWNSNTQWFKWNTNSTPSTTTPMWGRDEIGAHMVEIQVYTDTDKFQTDQPAILGKRLVRCDSARYFTSARPESCVYIEDVSRVEYSTASDSPNLAVAQHIQDAFANPDSTYPSGTGKMIPGEYTGTLANPGLHRLTESIHKSRMDANTAHKDAACSSTGEYSTTGLPAPLQPTLGEDCDEYPFRSTLEGAASPDWDFSVRAVNNTQNQSAGGSLSAFYNSDRILAWDQDLPEPYDTNDQFYVQIHP